MVYQVPKSKASLKQNRFEFKMPGSTKVYSVPKLEYVSPALRDRFSGVLDDLPDDKTKITQAQVQRMQKGFEAIFEHYVPGIIEKFEDSNQLNQFIKAWTDASKVAPGESSASSD